MKIDKKSINSNKQTNKKTSKNISFSTKSDSYEVLIRDDFNDLPELISALGEYSKIVIISDDRVISIYGNELKKSLSHLAKGDDVLFITFFNGEKYKNIATVMEIYSKMIEENVSRDAIVVALGGGVVGDIAGFVASTYMRGVDFLQIPTTLLACVDSSIGGKTGFDYMDKKNMIGSFYQPRLVYMPLSCLMSLDEKDYISAMAEIIKHALIRDKDYLSYIRENKAKILARDISTLSELIARSVEIKLGVVSADERESGLRKILNFGHSIGHAVESLLKYEKPHGECVSLGIVSASYISMKLGYINEDEYADILAVLSDFNLPIGVGGLGAAEVFDELFYDKKTRAGKLNIICLEKIGQASIRDDISDELIKEAISEILR